MSFRGAGHGAGTAALDLSTRRTAGSLGVIDGRLAPVTSELLRDAFDALPANVAVLDASGVVVAVNAAWSQFAEENGGVAGQLGVGLDYFGVCEASANSEPLALEAESALREIAAGERELYVADYRCDSPTQPRWFEMRATPTRGVGRVVVMHTDITQRRRMEQRARTQAALLQEIDAAVVALDVERRVTEWNRGAEDLYGWTRSEMLGQPADLLWPASQAVAGERRWAELELLGSWQGDATVLRRDGSELTLQVRTVALDDADGNREGYVAVATDIGHRLALERRLRDAAEYLQAVTNSVTDGLFALDGAGRATFVNDAAVRMLGWPREQLLGEVMHELTHYRHADGSPHLIADCPTTGAYRRDEVVHVTDDVYIRHDGSQLPVAYTASPFHSEDGVAGVAVVFRDISEEKLRNRRVRETARDFRWAERVREVLDTPSQARCFQLYAQPIVELASGTRHSEELLLRMRWDDELTLPAKFLAAATKHGLAPQVDRWVLAEAIHLARYGRAVSLNLSPRAFTDLDLLEELDRGIALGPFDPCLLTFEVEETAIIDHIDGACRFLTSLRERGCKTALDDFGAGHGGFSHFKILPLDYLKVGREFVRDLTANDASRHVVEAIVGLARSFDISVIGEGVESQPTLDTLRELGVDYAQGYLLGRPTPADAPITKGELAT